MKRFYTLVFLSALIICAVLVARADGEEEGPWTFWQFDTPQELTGQPLINGFRVTAIQDMTREHCLIHCQAGIFKITQEAGYADSVMAVKGYLIELRGDAYDVFRNGTPTPGLTREQDVMVAAYTAVVTHQGSAWAGSLKVAPAEE